MAVFPPRPSARTVLRSPDSVARGPRQRSCRCGCPLLQRRSRPPALPARSNRRNSSRHGPFPQFRIILNCYRRQLSRGQIKSAAGCASRRNSSNSRLHFGGLLLLHPMAGAFDQMTADHPRACGGLHRLEHAGALISAPILLARDEAGGHVDAAARPGLEFGVECARRAAAIPLQPALESGARIFGAVEGEFAVGKPLVGGDRLRRSAFPRRPFRPWSCRGPSRSRSAVLQVRPPTTISADRACCLSSPRSCDGNRRAGNHARLAARGACRRWPRASSSTIDNACADAAGWRARDARDPRASALRGASEVSNGSGGGPRKRRAHQRDRPEHIGPHQRAPRGDRAAEIMPDHGIDAERSRTPRQGPARRAPG